MRRRRGEPSLFEILRDPKDPKKEPGSTTSSSDAAREGGEGSGSAEPPRGFWAKVKGLRTAEDDVDPAEAVERRTSRPEAVRSEPVRSVPRTSEPEAPLRETPRFELDDDDGAPVETLEPAVRARAAQRALPPLPTLDWDDPAEEVEPPRGLVAWLNRTAEVRYSTFIVFAVGVILSTVLAYVSGTKAPNETQQKFQLEDSLDRAAWDPDEPGPVMHTYGGLKQPMKTIQPKKPVPTPGEGSGRKPQGSGAQAGDPRKKETPPDRENEKKAAAAPVETGPFWGIRVCRTDDVDGADKLLVELRRYEKSFGVKALLTRSQGRRGQRLVNVYFGPFPSVKEANKLLERVQALPTFRRTTFNDAMIEKIKNYPPAKRSP